MKLKEPINIELMLKLGWEDDEAHSIYVKYTPTITIDEQDGYDGCYEICKKLKRDGNGNLIEFISYYNYEYASAPNKPFCVFMLNKKIGNKWESVICPNSLIKDLKENDLLEN